MLKFSMSFPDLIEPHQHDLNRCLEIAFDHLGEHFNDLPWKGHLLEFDPNYRLTERLYFEIFGITFTLGRPFGIFDWHPHPWPLHVKRLLGSYEMGVGISDSLQTPTEIKIVTVNPGDSYEMKKNDWHYIKNLDETGDNLSLTVVGPFYKDRHLFYESFKEVIGWQCDDLKIPLAKSRKCYPMDTKAMNDIKSAFKKACMTYNLNCSF